MKIKCEVYGCLCSLSEFVINGIKADQDDFGEQGDASPETADEYCCGDMQFTDKASSPAVLEKYRITEEEYRQVCEKLTGLLSFGRCGWCE